MVTITQAKRNFFDRKGVIDAVGKDAADALSRGGGLMRTIARRSMRPGGANHKVSQPGEPPRAHTGLLRNRIIYMFERRGGPFGEVWVGPTLINRSAPVPGPELLEFGGTVHFKEGHVMRVKSGRNAQGHFQADRIVRGPARTVRVEARPYLGPALDKAVESGKLPDLWRSAALGGG